MEKAYIIAEIGVNFYDIAKQRNINPIQAAKLMCLEAKKAGANAAKFQSYKANKIVSKNSPAYWDTTKEPTKSQYELFQKFDHFNNEDYVEVAKYCEEIGIDFMSTPFDLDAVSFLDNLQSKFKIASADLTNYPLLRKVAMLGKPMLISTGAATEQEIIETYKFLLNINPEIDITFLHCVLSYPTLNENANLKRIASLQKLLNMNVGYSDHTLPSDGMAIVTAAYSMGATIIEKHFTLDKNLQGNDHYHAMDPKDLMIFRDNVDIIHTANSKFNKDYLPCEEVPRLQARRSLVLTRNVQQGEIITQDMIMCKRPGTGIATKYIKDVLGKTMKSNLAEDHILQWEDIND